MKCGYCKKIIKTPHSAQKYHKECSKEVLREKKKKYRHENRDKIREYYQRPEVKKRVKEYRQRPDMKKKTKEYYQRPEVKKRVKEWIEKYSKKNRVRLNKYQREKHLRKGFVKIKTAEGKTKLVYADGMGKEIQEQIPELTKKVMLKLLNKK